MTEQNNRIVPRYPSEVTLTKPSVAKILDADDYEDRQMIKKHDRAAAAQLSTGLRIDAAQAMLKSLAVGMDRSVKELHAQVKDGRERLDADNATDNVVVDFGDQALVTVADAYLKGIRAGGEYLFNQAGDDIREGIKPEPPVERAVIVQQTGPKIRPARLFEGGRTKYVIDD